MLGSMRRVLLTLALTHGFAPAPAPRGLPRRTVPRLRVAEPRELVGLELAGRAELQPVARLPRSGCEKAEDHRRVSFSATELNCKVKL